jgi:hypothetical protein
MNYRKTFVHFISSYQNLADYGVTLAGTSEERRVTVDRDGIVRTTVHGITGELEREYIAALLAYLEDKHVEYVEWAKARGFDVEPARVLTPVYSLRSPAIVGA